MNNSWHHLSRSDPIEVSMFRSLQVYLYNLYYCDVFEFIIYEKKLSWKVCFSLIFQTRESSESFIVKLSQYWKYNCALVSLVRLVEKNMIITYRRRKRLSKWLGENTDDIVSPTVQVLLRHKLLSAVVQRTISSSESWSKHCYNQLKVFLLSISILFVSFVLHFFSFTLKRKHCLNGKRFLDVLKQWTSRNPW